jgi:cysteine-rich repeat protein
MEKGSIVLACIVALVALATWAPNADAYSQYSVNKDATNCRACHGDFNAGTYFSFKDGAAWGTDLMSGHIAMLDGDCDACHSPGPKFPVLLGSSSGGTGFPPISCVGCHGREEDAGNDSVSPGRGAGLRQHHRNSGASTCACHFDGNPANYTPVGENVLPPYYFTPDANHLSKSTDPCDANGSESVFGATGLDNDGDLLNDGADPDCAAPVCGDGNLDAGEDCDDGNTNPGDCCAADCTFEAAGSACDDGLFCNGIETCDGAGSCNVPGNDPCDDGVGCTTDACNEGTDSCDNTPDDAACDDGLFCNGAETCDALLDCQAGTAVDCDDGVGCTTDACNEGTDSCDNIADLNNDTSVNIFDLVLIANIFGTSTGDAAYDPDMDCNQDGVINIFDLVTVAYQVGP